MNDPEYTELLVRIIRSDESPFMVTDAELDVLVRGDRSGMSEKRIRRLARRGRLHFAGRPVQVADV